MFSLGVPVSTLFMVRIGVALRYSLKQGSLPLYLMIYCGSITICIDSQGKVSIKAHEKLLLSAKSN